MTAVNNVYAVIILARALNERSRRLEKDYTQEALDYLDLVLNHSGNSCSSLAVALRFLFDMMRGKQYIFPLKIPESFHS